MRTLKAYVKMPGKAPYSTLISDSLENLQRFVGGYIETVTISSDTVIIVNEEGAIRDDVPFNCEYLGMMFFGPMIFTGFKGDEFDDIPIDFKTFKELNSELWEVDG